MELQAMLFVFILILFFFLYIYAKSNAGLKENNKELEKKKKSVEVRFGQGIENMIPFWDEFPAHPNQTRFLGSPIDFFCWDDEGVYIVEVKTGKSRLNDNQKKIKELIDRGKVYFKEIRY